MNERRFALIIANYQYENEKLHPLRAPARDAMALTQVLKDPRVGGFDHVDTLMNKPSHIIRREISRFFQKKMPKDLLLLYYSGHGIQDSQGRLYLTTQDTNPEIPRATALPSNVIVEEMDDSRSKRQVLILDCCYSGAFAEGTKAAIGTSVGTKKIFQGNGFGRIVLTSTDATQFAWEGNKIVGEIEHSLFTHYLIEGITTGQANPNKNLITIDDIYEYIYRHLIPHQNPRKWSYKQEGNIIIAHNPRFAFTSVKSSSLPTIVPPPKIQTITKSQASSVPVTQPLAHTNRLADGMLSRGHLLQGRYRIEKVLRHNGLTISYLASDTRLPPRQSSIIQMVYDEQTSLLTNKANFKSVFFSGSCQLAGLYHENIATTTDCIEEYGTLFLITRFSEGSTLREVLNKSKEPLSANYVLNVGLQLCNALNYLHSINPAVIHGDIKPDVIIQDAAGKIELVGFEVSLYQPIFTKSGSSLGTPGYFDPARINKAPDIKSDIYSVGVTLYELLSGYNPTQSPFVALPQLGSLNPKVPNQLSRAIMRAVERNPSRRYKTANEMSSILKQIRVSQG